MISLLSGINSIFGGEHSDLRSPADWLRDVAVGQRTVSGERVTADNAVTLISYHAMLRVIGEDTSKVDIEILKQLDGGDVEVQSRHNVHRLLNRAANPENSAIKVRELLAMWAAGWGGGIAEIQFNADGVTPFALWPIHPSRVLMKRDHETGDLIYEIRNDVTQRNPKGKPTFLEARQVVHAPGFGGGGDGVTGYSLAAIGAEAIGAGKATVKFSAAFFGNGANLGSIIKHPGPKMTEVAKTNFRRSWSAAHQTASKAGGYALLEDGMDYMPLAVPPEQAQFIETRRLTFEDMAMLGRVYPTKIGDFSHATFSNVSELNRAHADDTLGSWFVRLEQEYDRKLLVGPGEEDFFTRHDADSLKRGDMQARGDFYQRLMDRGALTINDVRRKERMNSIAPEVGDVHWVQENMTTAELAIKPPPEPTPGAPPLPPGQDAEAVRTGEIIEAHEMLFSEAAQRVLRKEVRATERAAKKHEGDAEAFRQWSAEWFTDHREFVYEALAPHVDALTLILKGHYFKAGGEMLRTFCNQHCQRSHEQRHLVVAEDIKDRADLMAKALTGLCSGIGKEHDESRTAISA